MNQDFRVGDRVRHKSGSDEFGVGTVRGINEPDGGVLVEWDNHEVTRETEQLPANQTHVARRSLTLVSRP